MTSAAPAVTAQDLELEHAELLGRKPSWFCKLNTRYGYYGLFVNDAACRHFRPSGVASGSSSQGGVSMSAVLTESYLLCCRDGAGSRAGARRAASSQETLWITRLYPRYPGVP